MSQHIHIHGPRAMRVQDAECLDIGVIPLQVQVTEGTQIWSIWKTSLCCNTWVSRGLLQCSNSASVQCAGTCRWGSVCWHLMLHHMTNCVSWQVAACWQSGTYRHLMFEQQVLQLVHRHVPYSHKVLHFSCCRHTETDTVSDSSKMYRSIEHQC
jgi:hypothetical protein